MSVVYRFIPKKNRSVVFEAFILMHWRRKKFTAMLNWCCSRMAVCLTFLFFEKNTNYLFVTSVHVASRALYVEYVNGMSLM